MNLQEDFPELCVVPTKTVHPHEKVDPLRLSPLAEAIQRQGILKDPPLVSPIPGKDGHFMVLDGATRTMAFRKMKIPYILVQVVRPKRDHIELKTWNYVTFGVEDRSFLNDLCPEIGLSLVDCGGNTIEPGSSNQGSLAFLHLLDGKIYELIGGDGSLNQRVDHLNTFVDALHEVGQPERTGLSQLEELLMLYPDLSGIVIFSPFKFEEVGRVVAHGNFIPAGLTRFIVSPRVLRLNFPLERLTEEESLEEKQRDLVAWVQKCMRERRVRFYAEAIYLFDG